MLTEIGIGYLYPNYYLVMTSSLCRPKCLKFETNEPEREGERERERVCKKEKARGEKKKKKGNQERPEDHPAQEVSSTLVFSHEEGSD